MNINAQGVMTCTRAITKLAMDQQTRSITTRNEMRDIERRSLVNLGSANLYAALPGKVVYVASKHAMMGITKIAGGFPNAKLLTEYLLTLSSPGLCKQGSASQRCLSDLGPYSDG